jgi:hypothetical protein
MPLEFIERIRLIMGVPDLEKKEWTNVVKLDSFGGKSKEKGISSECVSLDLKPGEYISNMRAKWDTADTTHGLTSVSVFTSEGYFVTMGKTTSEHS